MPAGILAILTAISYAPAIINGAEEFVASIEKIFSISKLTVPADLQAALSAARAALNSSLANADATFAAQKQGA